MAATVDALREAARRRMTDALFDIAGHTLGRPARVLEVRSKDELRAALREATETGRPFAAMGHRATYWDNLALEGAIVADLSGLDRIAVVDVDDGFATVECGVTIRALDLALRARGFCLPMHPDAYGDTLIGSAIANGVTAGIGMMTRDFLDQVVGFEAMLADGRTIQVGASRLAHARPGPIARGLPDVRSLFFGSEGALGVITEIDVALIPARWEARIEFEVGEERFEEALAFAKSVRRRGVPDTVRWLEEERASLSVMVSSAVDADELRRRVAWVLERLAGWPTPKIVEASEDERRGVLPGYDAKWPGPRGATWSRANERPFFGLDVVVPYSRAAEARAWGRALRFDVPHARRLAAYFGSDGVNVGVHVATSDARERDRARAALESRGAELSRFGAVPYRPGRLGAGIAEGTRDEPTIALLRELARAFRGRAVLNADVGVFGARATTVAKGDVSP